MKTLVKVYLRDRQGAEDSFTTPINLSPAEARAYYLGKWLNIGKGEEDYMMKCYKVSIIKSE